MVAMILTPRYAGPVRPGQRIRSSIVGQIGPAGPQGLTGPQGPPFTMEGVEDVTDWGAIPDGSTDSTDAIIEAYQNTPVGGGLYFPFGTGTYRIADRIQINKPIRIFGDTVLQHQGLVDTYGIDVMNLPLDPPYLSGSVVEQTAGGTDIFHVTAPGHSVHFRDLALMFASGIRFTNTGHGINATPTATHLGRPEMGLHSSWWERVTVFGHDGNHYAFKCTNQLCCRFASLRFYGGGGLLFINNAAWAAGNMGNLQCDDFYGQLFADGTAHGVHINAVAGTPNMFQFNRCQVTTNAPNASFGLGSSPAADQYCFYCDDAVRRITWVQGDFESGVGGKLRFPERGFTWDTAGILSEIPEYAPAGPQPIVTPSGTRYPVRVSDDHGNRCEYSNLDIGHAVATPGDSALGIRFPGLGVVLGVGADDGAAISGSVTNPRPSPRTAGVVACGSLDAGPVMSDGTDWSDIRLAPTIPTLTTLSNLTLDVIPSDMGVASGNVLGTLTNWGSKGSSLTAAGSLRPLYTTTVATPNGKGSAFFDGVDDLVTSTIPLGLMSMTYFFVVYFADLPGGGFDHTDLLLGSGNGPRVRIRNSPAGRVGFERQGWFGFPDSAYPILPDKWMLITVRYDGTTGALTYRVNCTPMGTASSVQTMTASNFRIGGGAPFYLARLAGYEHDTTDAGAKSDDDIKSIEKNIRAWGLLP